MEKAYKLEFAGEKMGGLYVNCCGCSKTEPLHSFGPALKPHYLIHYILSGKGKLSIGDSVYPLEAGYGFLITPEELTFYQSDEENPWTYVWVGFSGSSAEEYVRTIGLSASHPVFKSERSQELYQTVKDMMEHNTYGLADGLRRNGQLGIFLSIIAEGVPIVEKNESDRANTYVRKAVEFIQGNYCNPIKVTDVADYVCINRSYLYTLFQNSLGMSPQQFLMTFRITKATELLQLTTLSVESVALSCGYQDPIVFTKAFRQMKKMSPSAYRKDIVKGETRRNKEHLKQVEEFINQIKRIEN
ncbi:AraC family transcriptional regulator [Kineothrix sp. MB12-C1]|uniref:AraC family transcriptional regulator n=1 Tax=Kineothrix sp. MB12-C1 TaxID=3070215 RepID=UPI0027D29E49|nr:AraC family transcriptional regulator [Kineothrix sp. MB12-C1]WMC91356.1 AraC family transcriptional regulator [Kineothrix sp. MB12-C1]